MRAAAFSQRGLAWSERLGVEVERPESVMRWAAEAFGSSDALLFIGAVGIAVRAIAPLLRSKTVDPAVVVMDELGRHVIPILSGHIGGANELALEIARRTGAQPVITTATDINGVPAIDVWAKKHDCAIENPQAIKAVSSAVLSGGQVGVMITERDIKPPFEVTLKLRPRTLVLGAGCRRGTDAAAFERAALDFLKALEADGLLRVFDSCTNFAYLQVPEARALFAGLADRGIIVRRFGEEHLRITAGTQAEHQEVLAVLNFLLRHPDALAEYK